MEYQICQKDAEGREWIAMASLRWNGDTLEQLWICPRTRGQEWRSVEEKEQ